MPVDIRMRVQNIPRQVVLTKDNVTLSIDSVIYWEITDPYTAIYLVANVEMALVQRAQTTLRQVIGNRTLQQTIEQREEIGEEIKIDIEANEKSWGVNVESILISDIVLGKEIMENISG